MAQPTSATTVLRPDLMGLMEYDLAANRLGFIASKALPVVNVAHASGQYPVLSIESLLRTQDTTRSASGGYNRGDWKFAMDTFTTKENGFEVPYDENESRVYGDFFDYEEVCAELAVDAVLRNREIAAAALIQDASTFSATSITTEWSNATSADPVGDIKTGIEAVEDACGITPNTLIINDEVMRNLQHTDAIADMVKYVQKTTVDSITPALVAEALGIQQILVGKGMKNTAKEGQDASLSRIWSSEYASLCYVEPGQNLRRPTLGRSFHYTEDGSREECTIETYYSDELRKTILRARQQITAAITCADVHYLMSNITA